MESLAHMSGPATRINPRIFLLALGMFALGTDAFVVAGVLPVIAHDTQVSQSLAGQLITAFSLTYGLGAPVVAALIGRWPRNQVLIGALSLFCLANIGSAIAPTFGLLLVTRVLTGVFAAAYAPLAYTIGVSLAPPEKRGQALALVVMGLTVATALGSPLGTWIGEHLHWRLSFGLVAVLALIAALALLICGLPKAEAPAAVSLRARLSPITQPRIALALLPALLWNLGAQTLYTYIALLLLQTLHTANISGLLFIYGLGIVVGNWTGGALADRFGVKYLIPSVLVVLALVEAVLSAATTTWFGASIALFLWSLLGSLIFIPQQYRLLSVASTHANVILALNNSTLYLGIACGAIIGGIALHTIAVTNLGWIGAGCTLLALAVFALSLRFSARPDAHAEAGIEMPLVAPE